MFVMQASHPASKAKRRSNRITQDEEVSAQPPAGPIDDEIPPAASAHDASDAASDDPVSETAAAPTAVITAAAADDAAPLASSAPGASPQLSAKTSPHSRHSPSMSHHDDTAQDGVQSAELPGTFPIFKAMKTFGPSCSDCLFWPAKADNSLSVQFFGEQQPCMQWHWFWHGSIVAPVLA